MPFTATFTAITVSAAGLWVVCGSVFATAGWTAPACLAAEITSTVATVLAGITDYHNSRKKNQGHIARAEVQTFSRLHDNGWLEDYQGRMGELIGANETTHLVDMKRGIVHQVRTRGQRLVVRTDLKQVPYTLGKNTTNVHRMSEAPILGMPETFRTAPDKRITSSESAQELSSIFISGSNPTSQSVPDSDALNSFAGQSIANKAYELGTWCMTLSDNSKRLALLGLTLTGPKHPSYGDQSACSAK